MAERAPAPAEPLPPPPWQRLPPPPRRPRRDPITREAIVEAAMRVLDAEGLDGLSMRRVADELDTGAASLYRHVGSKDGLLDLLFDEIIGEQHVPDPDPERWREQLKEVARTMRATILRHRDVVRISIGRIPMGPNALTYSERVLAILRAGGVPDPLAVLGHHLLIATVNGYTLDETGEGGEPPPDQPPPDQAAAMVRNYVASLPIERFPNLVALADHLTTSDPDTRFELLLDLFVDGLAQRAADFRQAARPVFATASRVGGRRRNRLGEFLVPLTEGSVGFGISGRLLQVDAELAQLDDRRSAPADRVGRERQRERHPVRLAQRLALAQDAVVPRRRLDREADRLEAADEFANVFPHLGPGAPEDQLASFGCDRGRGHHGTPLCDAAVRHSPL